MAETLETIAIPGTNLNPTRIALGTWAIGGWMWGGTDAAESIRTIRSAVDRGINLIDTAPVYGFGRSEEIVGGALAELGRDKVLIATKVGLEWREGQPFRNASGVRIHKEIEDSLRRLRTDVIDIYQVHWTSSGRHSASKRYVRSSPKQRNGVSQFVPVSTCQDKVRNTSRAAQSAPPCIQLIVMRRRRRP
jgi:aryl-alcohol dehydrogenase-like predicted oxidoreductase